MKRIAAVSIYAAAMGYLESAVVIYLRELAFGNSVQVFPLRYFEPQLGLLEIGREVATIVMLLSVSYLAGRSRLQKWMFFVYSFAIWDIFYYIFLRIFTGWPSSLYNFDVLFLIPVIWIGPVLSPVLISLLLAVSSLTIILLREKSENIRIGLVDFGAFSLGSLIVFYSFTEQIFYILLSVGPKGMENFTPKSFDWLSFSIGYLIMCASAVKTIKDSYHKMKSEKVIQ